MDNYLAEIRPFAGNYAPQGWQLCQGQLLAISQNDALYSLLGTAFGGDGVTTFALPDLRGRLPVGAGQAPWGSTYPYGAKGGSETVTLNAAQMPAHSHNFMVNTGAANSNTPAGNLYADPTPNNFYATTPNPTAKPQVLDADTMTNSGQGMAHENRMPCMAINYIIAIAGTYPNFQ